MHKKKSTIGQKDGQKLKRQNAVQIAARAILRGESVFYNAWYSWLDCFLRYTENWSPEYIINK